MLGWVNVNSYINRYIESELDPNLNSIIVLSFYKHNILRETSTFCGEWGLPLRHELVDGMRERPHISKERDNIKIPTNSKR